MVPKQQKDEQAGKPTPLYYEPPKIISTKDIAHIHDMLNMNLLAIKQFRQAEKNCQLPDLQREFKEATQMHMKHFDNLLKLLSGNGGSV